MEIDGDVLVQAVEEAPRRLLAHRLYPGRNVEVAGARGVGVRHHHVALVDRIEQVLPRCGLRQVLLLGLDLVEAHGADERKVAHPVRRVVPVLELHVDGVVVGGLVRVEHPLLGHDHHARRGQDMDDVGLRIVLLRQQLRRDDAGRVPHPADLDVRMHLVESFPVELQVFRCGRRVHRQRRVRPDRLCGQARKRRCEHRARCAQTQPSQQSSALRHRNLLPVDTAPHSRPPWNRPLVRCPFGSVGTGFFTRRTARNHPGGARVRVPASIFPQCLYGQFRLLI